MSSFKPEEFFKDNKNHVLVASGIVIIALAGLLIWWVLSPKFELLVSPKNQSDLASATEELRKNNIPFKLGENGNDILVDQKNASRSRQILNDLGLQYDNSVGLELFATSDFGITDFAQKINYKRAMEGELTRTISALDEVRYARVHLVLPEKKLFDPSKSNASASVTLFMKDGYSLSQKRIEGIQSLVANSVSDIKNETVTVLDQRGVELSKDKKGLNEVDISSLVEEKVGIEQYMRNKVDRILSKIFNIDDYSIEVDVRLSTDLVKTTEKRLLPLDSGKGAIILNKENRKENNGKDDKTAARTVEQKFEYGSLLEEKQALPGKLEKITIAVFIYEKLSSEEETDLKSLLSAAIGAPEDNGSFISIFSKNRPVSASKKEPVKASNPEKKDYFAEKELYIGVAVWSLLLICVTTLLARRNRLSNKERQLLVEKIKQWDEVNKNG